MRRGPSLLPCLLGLVCLPACGTQRDGGAAPAAGRAVLQGPGSRNPLVGQPLGSLALMHLEPDDGRPLGVTAQPLTLLRFWTVDCPFCRASLPDLSRLAGRFAPRLQLVAVYHPKAPGRRSNAELHAYLRDLGVRARLARDDEWRVLESLRQRGGLGIATSISLLVDQQGVVRWVHPGPRLHRSDEPAFAPADADARELEQVVAALLDAPVVVGARR